jgi:acetyltransferase-like isoleucine patch superfamily enzyme
LKGAVVIRDHRPYFVKQLYLKIQEFYTRHFLKPQFGRLGKRPTVIKPWQVEVFGHPVELGDYATVIAAPDARVRLSIWPATAGRGGIFIGRYCMICPGVRIGSAERIDIGDNCMIASRVYITDCDWHGLYNRLAAGKSAPVCIESNVWIGDSAIVCKGVRVGENSIIGAGAVVVDDIPANSVAAGNPARVVKGLDPDAARVTRSRWFADPARLFSDIDRLDREALKPNSLGHWIRHLLFPRKGD